MATQLTLNHRSRSASWNNTPVELTRSQFHLLTCLALFANTPCAYPLLYSALGKPTFPGLDEAERNNIRTHIGVLRSELKPFVGPRTIIESANDLGYILTLDLEDIEMIGEPNLPLLPGASDQTHCPRCNFGFFPGMMGVAGSSPDSLIQPEPPLISRCVLMLDRYRNTVTVAGEAFHLSHLCFELLLVLCAQPEQSHSRTSLIRQVWGAPYAQVEKQDTHIIDVHLSIVRQALEQAGGGRRIIRTIRGFGFQLSPDVFAHITPPITELRTACPRCSHPFQPIRRHRLRVAAPQ